MVNLDDYLGGQFGNYRLIRFIEGNRHVRCYLGEHIHRQTQAHIKILSLRMSHYDVVRFRRNVQGLSALAHPHIVRVLDFDAKMGLPFFAVDYGLSRSLHQRYPKGERLPLPIAIAYARQVADALQYAYGQKVIPPGLRPTLLFCEDNNQILLDFATPFLEALDAQFGGKTLVADDAFDYIDLNGAADSGSQASQQYSLGSILYEWITGSLPFSHSTGEALNVLRYHQYLPPPPLREKVGEVSPSVEGVILTTLAKQSEHRFPDIRSFATALERASALEKEANAATRLGQQFGNYRLIRLLGQGGFADAYLGEHNTLKTQTAIKILRTRLTAEDLDGFLREAQTIARLRHPQIVRVLEFAQEAGTPFLVMEYAPNGSLRQRHPKGVRLPLLTIVSYVKQIADALQYAHDQKLIHRDIKPENFLLDKNHKVLLSDFGISVIAESTSRQQAQGFAGTVAYSAPEQLQEFPRQASDQYSLGVVVYEWICGKVPFTGSLAEMAGKHVLVTPPPLRDQMPTLPLAFEQAVMKALAKDPKDRFASVQEFATALERVIQANPDYANACLEKARTFEIAGRHEEALKAYEEAIELAPTVAQTHLSKGLLLHELKRYQQALSAYERVIQLDPKNVRGYQKKGEIFHTLRQYEDALSTFERIIELEPKEILGYTSKAALYRDLKRYEDALIVYEDFLQRNPNVEWGYEQKVSLLRELKRDEEVLRTLDRAIGQNPEAHWGYSRKAQFLEELNRYEEALTILEQSIQMNPKIFAPYLSKGRLLRGLRRYDEALAVYEQFIPLNPSDEWGYQQKASLFQSLGRYDEALATLDRSIHANPRAVWRYRRKIDLLNKLGRRNDVLATLEHFIQNNPHDHWGYDEKVSLFRKAGNSSAALATLERFIQAHPTERWGYETKSWLLRQTGNYTEALAMLEHFNQANPGEQWGYKSKISLLTKMNRYEEALVTCEHLIRLDPTGFWAYGHKVSLLWRLQRSQEALTVLDKFVRLNLNMLEERNNIARLLEALQSNEAALAVYEQVIRAYPQKGLGYFRMGQFLERLGRYDEAENAYLKQLELECR